MCAPGHQFFGPTTKLELFWPQGRYIRLAEKGGEASKPQNTDPTVKHSGGS